MQHRATSFFPVKEKCRPAAAQRDRMLPSRLDASVDVTSARWQFSRRSEKSAVFSYISEYG
jgi:hypothetical protein